VVLPELEPREMPELLLPREIPDEREMPELLDPREMPDEREIPELLDPREVPELLDPRVTLELLPELEPRVIRELLPELEPPVIRELEPELDPRVTRELLPREMPELEPPELPLTRPLEPEARDVPLPRVTRWASTWFTGAANSTSASTANRLKMIFLGVSIKTSVRRPARGKEKDPGGNRLPFKGPLRPAIITRPRA